MKNKKILLIFFMVIATILTSTNFVYADSFTVTMQPDKQNYAEGQTVEVIVALANIESNYGLYGLSGKLDYNTDVFEEIISDEDGNTEDIISLNKWSGVTYNSKPGKDKGTFSTYGSSPIVTGTQSIMKIRLKVKQGAPLGKATIQLSNLSASNGEGDVSTAVVSIGVNIQSLDDVGGGEIPSVTTTPSPEPTQVPQPSPSPVTPNNGGSSSQGGSSSSNGGSKLPQTGLAKDVILPIIIGAVIISGVSFIAYRKYKDI